MGEKEISWNADADAGSMTPSRNTRRYTLRSVQSSPGRSFLKWENKCQSIWKLKIAFCKCQCKLVHLQIMFSKGTLLLLGVVANVKHQDEENHFDPGLFFDSGMRFSPSTNYFRCMQAHTQAHTITQRITVINSSAISKNPNKILNSCSHIGLWNGNIYLDLGVAKLLGGEHHWQCHRSYH